MKSVYIFRSYGPYDDPVGSKHVDTFHNKLVCLTENLFFILINDRMNTLNEKKKFSALNNF